MRHGPVIIHGYLPNENLAYLSPIQDKRGGTLTVDFRLRALRATLLHACLFYPARGTGADRGLLRNRHAATARTVRQSRPLADLVVSLRVYNSLLLIIFV